MARLLPSRSRSRIRPPEIRARAFDREKDAGVDWSIAGENVGEGGQVSDSSNAIAQMGKELTTAMLNERPPNDGHRKNILSSAFHHIGIAIFRDRHGMVWLTQDFSN